MRNTPGQIAALLLHRRKTEIDAILRRARPGSGRRSRQAVAIKRRVGRSSVAPRHSIKTDAYPLKSSARPRRPSAPIGRRRPRWNVSSGRTVLRLPGATRRTGDIQGMTGRRCSTSRHPGGTRCGTLSTPRGGRVAAKQRRCWPVWPERVAGANDEDGVGGHTVRGFLAGSQRKGQCGGDESCPDKSAEQDRTRRQLPVYRAAGHGD